jgi:glutathione S-transferase
VVKRVETALARGPWLMGADFSAVDLLVGSALNFARKAFPESEAIDAFVARCKARPASLRAVDLDEATGLQRAA